MAKKSQTNKFPLFRAHFKKKFKVFQLRRTSNGWELNIDKKERGGDVAKKEIEHVQTSKKMGSLKIESPFNYA